jgi:hypothetical protein
MFGSAEALVFMIVLWVLSAWVFYMIVKAAVRNGILEADAARARLATQRDGALSRAVSESKRALPDD